MAPLFTGSKFGTFKKGYPNIITNGLILRLDPAISNSYSGIGTSYYDISESKNDGLLYNGTSYNNINEGVLTFNNNDNYIQSVSSIISLTNTFTISAWVFHKSLTPKVMRYSTIGSDAVVIRYDGVSFGSNNSQLHFYINLGGTLNHIRVNNSLTTNEWYHVVGTWDGTTQKLYKNTALVGSSTPSGTLTLGTPSYNVSSNSPECIDGNIGEVCLYNRALSLNEIQKNYETIKGRYRA